MPAPWSLKEKRQKYEELNRLYVREGRTISEIGKILYLRPQTIFQRLQYFNIPSNTALKKRQDIAIPKVLTLELAEFFGVMLGDGGFSKNQVFIHLGSKEVAYANYLVDLVAKIFHARPKICVRKTGHRIIYLGSVDITAWLVKEGLVHNKVLSQVNVPTWILGDKNFAKEFLRGFFDTDGSVYKLRWGIQISFTNKSLPLLHSVRKMLLSLKYNVSQVSGYKVYITKREDVERFFKEVSPKNPKHCERFHAFFRKRVGT